MIINGHKSTIWRYLVGAFLVLCVAGCGVWVGLNHAAAAIKGSQQPEVASVVSYQRVWLGKRLFVLERAATEAAIRKGLMGRTHLAAHQGMWFEFPEATYQYFWMKNTLIPLDIIYVRMQSPTAGVVVQVVSGAMPCKADPCTIYPSQSPADRVVELAGGQANVFGIVEGTSVRVQPLR